MSFDENTFFGFCVLLYLNYVAGVGYIVVTTLIATLFVTAGLFFNTFRAHFELMFQNMGDLVTKHRRPDYATRLKACLIEAINFHNQAKEYANLGILGF